MRFSPNKLIRMALVSVLFATCLAAPAWAARGNDKEDDGPFRERGIEYAASAKPWIQWLAGAAIIGACLAIGAKNPHRSHLD